MAKKILVSIFIFCMLLSAAGNASAALFGATGKPWWGDPYEKSTLYEVDQNSGETTAIGDVGYLVSGMDYFDGTLYGVTSMNDPDFHGLITIDTLTGAGTPVGAGWPHPLGDPNYTVVEMAINSEGNAYGWREIDGDALIPIDLNSGTLGESPGDPGLRTSMLGLAFGRITILGEFLYLINKYGNFYSIDTDTGAGTLLGNLGVFAAHHGDVDPATGVYWGLSDAQSDIEILPDMLPIDLSTQTVLPSVPVKDIRLHTLAFIPEPVPIPTTMFLLGSGLIGLVGFRRKFRKK